MVEAYDRLVAEGFLTSRPGSGLFVAATESAGVVADYVYGAGMHWQGGRGGFPCDGSGSLNKWNVIGELKAATPLGGGSCQTRPSNAALSAIAEQRARWGR